MDLTADYFIDANGLPNIKNNKNGNFIRPNCPLSNSCDKNSFRKFSNQNGLLSVREQLNNKTLNDKKLINCENEQKKLKTFYNEIIKKKFQNKDSFSHLRSDNKQNYQSKYDNKIFGSDQPNKIILPPLEI